MILRHVLFILAAVLSGLTPLMAQAATGPARRGTGGLYLTVFRSPSTGLEFREGPVALHAGWYPTILKADGQPKGENTNFVRVGGSAYLRSRGVTPYLSPALLLSLDDDWDDAILTEAGVRVPLGGPAAFRIGAGLLTAFNGEVRINPTVGLDVRLGFP